MKRTGWMMLLAIGAGLLLLGGLVFADDDGYGPGWGRRGPGMMWGGGYGPGMMGRGWGEGGYGPGMMGGGMMGLGGAGFSQLPADKQEQLRKLYVTEGQSMVVLMADMQAKASALQEAMNKFPVDESAAKKAHEVTDKVRDQMFALHLSTLAQAQKVIGKEAWEKLQAEGYGPGYGPDYRRGRGPGMMGPGGRGPNQ